MNGAYLTIYGIVGYSMYVYLCTEDQENRNEHVFQTVTRALMERGRADALFELEFQLDTTFSKTEVALRGILFGPLSVVFWPVVLLSKFARVRKRSVGLNERASVGVRPLEEDVGGVALDGNRESAFYEIPQSDPVPRRFSKSGNSFSTASFGGLDSGQGTAPPNSVNLRAGRA